MNQRLRNDASCRHFLRYDVLVTGRVIAEMAFERGRLVKREVGVPVRRGEAGAMKAGSWAARS
jgi:hypothetical protein